jgi:Concanavalin A-like lectin/glucanases superfamily
MPGIDSFTKLCLHCDGADASTSFPDASASGHTITPVGNAQVDTAQSKFGGAALLLDGTGDALQLPMHADFAFGTGNFAIDFWLRPAASPLNNVGIFDWRAPADGLNNEIILLTQGTGEVRFLANGANQIVGTTILAAGTWYHLAVVRSSGTTRLFVNGVQEGGNYTDGNNYTVGSTVRPAIGLRSNLTGNGVNGWIDEFRISKGTDRGWSGGFTPPTAAYSAALARVQAAFMG